MSWSVFGTGKAGALAVVLAEQFSRGRCDEPEETVKQAVAVAVAAVLAKAHPEAVFTVQASGSQYRASEQRAPGLVSLCTVDVKYVAGFIE